MKDLKELISEVIKDANDGTHVSNRVTSFTNYDSKYIFPKNVVKVSVELTTGKTFTIDVTDYFYGEEK